MTDFTRALRRLALILPAVLLAPQPLLAQEPAPPTPQHLTPAGGTPWIYEGSDVPRDKEWIFGELPNGLRYAVRSNAVPPDQVSVRVRIDAGSLHEDESELGYAHLLEHLLFRESKYLGPAEAIPTWQRLGATFGSDTNAETSPTHTVFKLDLPNVDAGKLAESMKLLSGMVRSPVLSDANVQAEVPIVLAEKRERGGPAER
ncbi:MAG: peptidase M16, partial [Erythrobacteraceae bacterium]|nr:peptidase M16 [Erythrobacteraceae bacterium]